MKAAVWLAAVIAVIAAIFGFVALKDADKKAAAEGSEIESQNMREAFGDMLDDSPYDTATYENPDGVEPDRTTAFLAFGIAGLAALAGVVLFAAGHVVEGQSGSSRPEPPAATPLVE